MANRTLFALLSKVVKIKPGEEKIALLLFSCFFLITSPHTIIKALRSTDLLIKLGTGALPIAYFFAAIVTGIFVYFQSKIHIRVSRQSLITATLVFFSGSGLILHVLFRTNFGRDSAFLSYLFWVWASVLITVLLTHFWMIVNDVFNPREAKRLIGFCGSGGILGGILGGLLAGFLTRLDQADFLLPLASLLIAGNIFIVRAVFRYQKKQRLLSARHPSSKTVSETRKIGLRDSFQAATKNSYMLLIAVVVIVTVIASTFIDFQFNSAVSNHFSTRKADMQAFFGFFFSALLGFAFLLNFFLTGSILKRFGIRITLILTPALLVFGTLGIILTPFALFPAMIIKGADEGLSFSLNQSIREILYIPVASELKARAKPFIDMFINRFAKVLAALILLIYALSTNKQVEYLTPTLDVGLAKELSWAILAFLIVWIVLGIKIGKAYVTAVKQNIKIKWRRADKAVREKVDVDYAKLIFDTIESRERSSVLYAMHLFDLLEQKKLSPEIRQMISSKSEEVAAASIGDLFSAQGVMWFPEIGDESDHEDLITNVREIMALDSYQDVMRPHAERIMDKDNTRETRKLELAKAISLMDPNAPLAENLALLIADNSAEVSCYAIQSAARLNKAELIPAIILRLNDLRTREEASTALTSFGQAAVDELENKLLDPEAAPGLKKAVIQVLARIGTKEAVKVLVREIDGGNSDLDPDIIDALDRIHSASPEIPIPARAVKHKTLLTIGQYCRNYIRLQEMDSEALEGENRTRLEKIQEVLYADIFKLLGLVYPHEDTVKAYQNLQTGKKESVAYAVELLDNILKKEVKDLILPLVEDLSTEEKIKAFRRIIRNTPESVH